MMAPILYHVCDSCALPKSSVFHVERDAGGAFLVEEADIQRKTERLPVNDCRNPREC